MDESRSVNERTSQIGRSDGMRPAVRIDADMDWDGGGATDYQSNYWYDEEQPATTWIRRRRQYGSISSDDIPSPLQQELDRMRTVGEANTVDTKTLRGKKYYGGESSVVIASGIAQPGVLTNQRPVDSEPYRKIR